MTPAQTVSSRSWTLKNLAWAFSETEKQLHQAALELDGLAVLGDLLAIRIDAPCSDPNRGSVHPCHRQYSVFRFRGRGAVKGPGRQCRRCFIFRKIRRTSVIFETHRASSA